VIGQVAELDEVVPLTRVEDDSNDDAAARRSIQCVNDSGIRERIRGEVNRPLRRLDQLRVDRIKALLCGVVNFLRQSSAGRAPRIATAVVSTPRIDLSITRQLPMIHLPHSFCP
ncbi:MAG TPA: hypothetical protein VFW73_05950, partial [Lacipirellulaceae bacterium]|nr:hypothetical protein [Lacipirellulaceae bacterium]